MCLCCEAELQGTGNMQCTVNSLYLLMSWVLSAAEEEEASALTAAAYLYC